MTDPIHKVAPFKRDQVAHVKTPCLAYHGFSAAIATYNGIPVILTAATRQALVDAVKEINPNIAISLALCEQTAVIHSQYVSKATEDEEEL